MGTTEKQYWFPAKRYGWGWGPPHTWQGWLVVGTHLAVVIGPLAFAGMLSEATMLTVSLVGVVVGTPLLLVVCLLKGEPPRWRWGGRDDL